MKQQHLSRAEGKALLAKPKKQAKYRNTPVTIDGIRFASKKEATRYLVLKAKEVRGEISNLELQPVFKLAVGDRPVQFQGGRQAKYIADFAYWNGSRRVVEDAKGFKTREYLLKKALVEAMFPAVRIVEI